LRLVVLLSLRRLIPWIPAFCIKRATLFFEQRIPMPMVNSA